MAKKEKVIKRLSNRYSGDYVEVYETQRLEDIRDKDVFQREVEIVQKFLEDSKKGKLLDVACGTGRVFPFYKNREVFGSDISKDMLKIAKKRLPEAKLKASNAENLPYKDKTFSVVITSRFIMHTPEYEKIIKEMARVLKPGGSLIIDFPNRISLSYFTTKVRLSVKSSELKYFNLFTLNQIKKIAEKNGLKICDIQAKTFFPAKTLPKFLHGLTKRANRLLVSVFPLFSTPLYVRFVKNG